MVTMQEIVANGYRVPGREYENHEQTAEQIKAARYLETLSIRTGVSLSGVDILETFKREDGHLHTEPRELNKLLFALENTPQEEPPEDLSAVSLNEEEQAFSHYVNQPEEALRRLESDLSTHRRRWEHCADEMEAVTCQIMLVNQQITALRNAPETDIAQQTQETLKRIKASSFWDLVGASRGGVGVLTLQTKNPVIMTYRNPAAGIDIELNLGTFRIALEFQEGRFVSCRVKKHRNNIRSSGHNYYHPYISTNGRVCWGESQATAHELITAGDIWGYLELLQGLLITYSPQSAPHIPLESLAEDRRTPGNSNSNCRNCFERASRCSCSNPDFSENTSGQDITGDGDSLCNVCEERYDSRLGECPICG